MKKFALFLFLAGVIAGANVKPVEAAELKPMSAAMTMIGTASALSYYTVERNEFRVVTMIQFEGDETGHPLVFKNSLRPGQSVVVSVPTAANGHAVDLWLARVGNRLLIGPRTTVASN
jgi:hypothetical protein